MNKSKPGSGPQEPPQPVPRSAKATPNQYGAEVCCSRLHLLDPWCSSCVMCDYMCFCLFAVLFRNSRQSQALPTILLLPFFGIRFETGRTTPVASKVPVRPCPLSVSCPLSPPVPCVPLCSPVSSCVCLCFCVSVCLCPPVSPCVSCVALCPSLCPLVSPFL